MRKIIWTITAAALALSVTFAPQASAAQASKEEAIGVGAGGV